MLNQLIRARDDKVVVLDDDPTGTQSVHGIPVLTEWRPEVLRAELVSSDPVFYLLTNTRSMSLGAAQALNREIGVRLRRASLDTGRPFVVVSRSDSILRGHYPGELDALTEGLGTSAHALLLIPCFLEGGRYTVNDVHYVASGDWLVPAGETDFARDPVFGYTASNLAKWVEERTDGRIPAASVASVSLQDVREGGPDRVAQILAALPVASVCVVNALTRRDLEVFTLGLLLAEERGHRFVYRTAASFIPLRAGLTPRGALKRCDFDLRVTSGGLIVAGSYVPQSSAQVGALLRSTDVHGIEVDVERLLAGGEGIAEVQRVSTAADARLAAGEDVLVYTSREVVNGRDHEQSLAFGQHISAGLVDIVAAISTRPRYILAKGGITSSDIATRALGVRRALVRGQVMPGVSVWKIGAESRHPGLDYIVFPGNVGHAGALMAIVRVLRADRS